MDARLEKILKLPAYQRFLILCGLLVVIVGLFAYLLYLPQQEKLTDLQNQKSSLEIKLQQDRNIARNLPKFKAEYEKLKTQLDLALTQLPNEKEIPTLLTSISALAKENGLDVTRFKPDAERPKGFYAEVPVELKLVGSYHQVALFCQAVGNLARIVNISNVTLANPKSRGDQTLLSVTCLATTFRFLENSGGKTAKRKSR